jgi:heme/copper-type cytochrome/quinol oxidase subunit 2
MSVPGVARACALVALSASLTAACGTGGPSATSTTTTTSTSASSPPSALASTGSVSTATTADESRTIDVVYAHGQVTGGVRTETVRVGDKVRLRVTSDVSEEIHVHTYDAMADVAPGMTAQIELTATIPGRHEVELEKSRKQLLVLEVR